MLNTIRRALSFGMLVGCLVIVLSGSVVSAEPRPQRCQATCAGATVAIAQIYGGGGNSGATYTNDFIVLHNRTTTAINMGGWSLQYSSATGTVWQVTAITSVLQPGQSYLIQQAQGAGGTTPLPTPDAIGSIAMSGTSGKVALVNTTTALSGACPLTTAIQDFVGYSSSANCFEGSAGAPTLSNTQSAHRGGMGCVDSDDNSADFTASPPSPRNSSSPLSPCTPPTAIMLTQLSTTQPPTLYWSLILLTFLTVTVVYQRSFSSVQPDTNRKIA